MSIQYTKSIATSNGIKLNLGSKHRKLEGFDNLDKIFGWLFQNGLPQYQDGSVDGITISHALMFLTPAELTKFMKEMWRVLKIDGVVRITEDDTENPLSDFYQTGNIKSNPSCLTGPNMMRGVLEETGFKVYDVDRTTTHFSDNSLMQAYRGGAPNVFFIEGVKQKTKTSVLMEGIKNQGKPFKIPNCSRDELPQFFVDMGFKVGAEIGVYKGEFSEKFCKVGLNHFAIDPWIAFPGQGRTQQVQERQDFLYGHTKRVLDPYPNCTVIRKTSMDAVKDFINGSLDYVYIDGNHELKYIVEDIVEWSKKIKKGGIVSGHDYWNTNPLANNVICHGEAAVNAYTQAYGIKNFYIFGKMYPLEEQKKDNKWFSWMFIKQ